jgi:hypothetical protein
MYGNSFAGKNLKGRNRERRKKMAKDKEKKSRSFVYAKEKCKTLVGETMV